MFVVLPVPYYIICSHSPCCLGGSVSDPDPHWIHIRLASVLDPDPGGVKLAEIGVENRAEGQIIHLKKLI
jgi:hypothetical protein